MTIDEAIEIKSCEGEEFLHTDPDKLEEADRLSIEALKRVRDNPIVANHFFRALLPGETTD